MPPNSQDSQSPVVSIGHLSIRLGKTTNTEPWFCVFPQELREIGFSRSQLTLWGEITRVAGDFVSEGGKVLVRAADLNCFTYQYRQALLIQLSRLGVLRKAGIGLWAVNPRYAWAGSLRLRQRAIESFEGHSTAEGEEFEEEK